MAAGCKPQASQTASKPEQQAPTQAGGTEQAAAQGVQGTVIETMNAGRYTYVEVDTGNQKIWAAAPAFEVKVGDAVVVPQGMPVANFHSESLNRDFEQVYFVSSVAVKGDGQAMAPDPGMPLAHSPKSAGSEPAGEAVALPGVAKAEGGSSIAEIFAGQSALSGKEVVVRGKVVKFSSQILGTNWLHIQDGTGSAGTNDLTVTTDDTAKVGDTVLVTGLLAINKDFGAGYKYDVILEKATVKVE
jgi:hypothetical protein